MEACKHECPKKFDKETGYERCVARGKVLNVSKKEFYANMGDDGFFDDEDF